MHRATKQIDRFVDYIAATRNRSLLFIFSSPAAILLAILFLLAEGFYPLPSPISMIIVGVCGVYALAAAGIGHRVKEKRQSAQ